MAVTFQLDILLTSTVREKLFSHKQFTLRTVISSFVQLLLFLIFWKKHLVTVSVSKLIILLFIEATTSTFQNT